MRVELIYTPGCNSYQNTRKLLEAVIAEERLPLTVEVVEAHVSERKIPGIFIDGHEVSAAIEQIREVLATKWKDLTHMRLPSM
jgi:hypothetical protein